MKHLLIKHFLKYRRPLIVMLHLGMIVAANYLAFWLRFDGFIDSKEYHHFWTALPWVVAIRAVLFIPFHLYQGLWRYTGIWDVRNICLAVLASLPVLYAVITWGLEMPGYPKSVYVIDAIALVSILIGIRLTRRIHHELGKVDSEKRVLIYGGGNAGEGLVLSMQRHDSYDPVGIVDDDPHKVGRRIHGVPVLGRGSDIPLIIESTNPTEIVIAIPSAQPSQYRRILRSLEPFKLPIKTLPSLRDMLDGNVTVNQIRDLSMEDVLLRNPVQLDLAPVTYLLRGSHVLVTGAGGSIGSELCRQIARCEPASLILLDRYENTLFSITNDLNAQYAGQCVLESVIADISDKARMVKVIGRYSPDIIFHAAAHKHVPLMEENPCEAVKNNVLGTLRLAEAAIEGQVQRFILISTDKAVNPTSVMGATKRIAEYITMALNQTSRTAFDTVRFGNVLGSNGSVVPTFLEQIRQRRPVTVTHPEIRRYFMSIPEAVSLILHTCTIGKGGEIFVLEMGEQINIADLARHLIRLAGYIPDTDIPIEFVGLRPGEKLSEELVESGEILEPTETEKINRVRVSQIPDLDDLLFQIGQLKTLSDRNNEVQVKKLLGAIVPTYRPAMLSDSPEFVTQRVALQ